MKQLFAAKCCPVFALQVHINYEMMQFVPASF